VTKATESPLGVPSLRSISRVRCASMRLFTHPVTASASSCQRVLLQGDLCVPCMCVCVRWCVRVRRFSESDLWDCAWRA
jgi:hypothetical protein